MFLLFISLAVWSKGLAPGQAFDICTPSPVLVQYIQEGKVPEGRALVPGCGRGYDVTALASPTRKTFGWEISPTGIEAAKKRLNELSTEECPHKENTIFELVNFFDVVPSTDAEKFDFIYDYTFLCALGPSIRQDWARKMSELMKPGGELLTLIFPINADREGTIHPPFPVTLELLKGLLEPVGFECLELRLLPKELCHPGRDGTEENAITGMNGEKIIGKSGVGRWRKL